MTISKELLNAVLNIYICVEDMNPYIQDNMVIYDILDYKSINTKHINIYEFTYKCKEWAYKYHKIIINSRTTSKTKDINGYAEIIKSCDYLYGDYADTEIEAIIQACQWILDNKEFMQ